MLNFYNIPNLNREQKVVLDLKNRKFVEFNLMINTDMCEKPEELFNLMNKAGLKCRENNVICTQEMLTYQTEESTAIMSKDEYELLCTYFVTQSVIGELDSLQLQEYFILIAKNTPTSKRSESGR